MSPRTDRFARSRRFVLALPLVLAALLPAAAAAQPFGAWNVYHRSTAAYIEIPHASALNPISAITIEGWVNVTDPGGCSNIIGKGWQSSWWIGVCGSTLRSYLRGSASVRNGGTITGGWNHFAVTFDGAVRRHYINGEEVGNWAEPGDLPANTQPVRIGSDVNFATFYPDGAINEIRLWNVARTVSQLRATINVPITAAMPGLVAVWRNGGPEDAVGPHDGVRVGGLGALTFPVSPGCGASTATSLCVNDRHVVTARWRTDPPGGTLHNAQLAPLATAESGLFWFFSATNWEVMVKVLNGCGLNDRWWVFSAATTNVFYRLEVLDVRAGANKVYFNYPGPPAPAVTDVDALATCP